MKTVEGILFEADDVDVLVRVLQGHQGALGLDSKNRDRVARHARRFEVTGDPYFADDLTDLSDVLHDLIELWLPQTRPGWWRENGAPGTDETVEGLARERDIQVGDARRALALVRMAQGFIDPDLHARRSGEARACGGAVMDALEAAHRFGVDVNSPAAAALRAIQKFDELETTGDSRRLLIEAEDELGRLLGLACSGVREPGDGLFYDHAGGTCPIHEWLVEADSSDAQAEVVRGRS